MPERQITTAPHGHLLTNAAVWSPDSRWIVYDVRSSPDGAVFDGVRIERVEVESGRVEVLYESRHGACCGVVTASPLDDRTVFILGPEHPTEDWRYGPPRRQGVIARTERPGVIERLDARDMVPPFTPGALRGGSHVHLFSSDARLVSFTYEDALLDAPAVSAAGPREKNLRGVGVAVCGRPVDVPATHPRNHDGTAFSVLVTRLVDSPAVGSDEIARACEESWIGSNGYVRPDGSRQRYALAFQGEVAVDVGGSRSTISEVFVCDLPDDPASLELAGTAPLEGTPARRPAPPRGVSQRRITFTAGRQHPGIQGPRHWLRSSPDGTRIAFLMRDDEGFVQLFTVDPNGGEPRQVTRDHRHVASAFTWSPDGASIACVADGRVQLVHVAAGGSTPLTDAVATPPRPEACVFSPDGRRIAFMRSVPGPNGLHNQIFVVDVPDRA